MDTVFKFLFEFLGQFFGAIWGAIVGIFTGIGEAFNFPKYVEMIENYTTTLGGLAWVIAIVAIILLVAVLLPSSAAAHPSKDRSKDIRHWTSRSRCGHQP